MRHDFDHASVALRPLPWTILSRIFVVTVLIGGCDPGVEEEVEPEGTEGVAAAREADAPATETITDEDVVTALRTELALDPIVAAHRVSVEAHEWWARDRMKRLDEPLPDDEDVARAIDDALLYDPRVAAFRIDVTVENGLAMLDGFVTNPAAREAAEEDARNTVGVYRVRNFITVRPHRGAAHLGPGWTRHR